MAEEVDQNVLTTDPVAARFLADLERVQVDLGIPLRHHASTIGWPIVVMALVETCGTMAALLVKDRPETRPHLLARLAELHLYISTVGTTPQ